MATLNRPYKQTTNSTNNNTDMINARVKCIMGSHVNQKGTIIAIPATGRVSVKYDDGQIRTYNTPGTDGSGVVRLRGRRPNNAPTYTPPKKSVVLTRARKTGKVVVQQVPSYIQGGTIGSRRKVVNNYFLVKHRGVSGTVLVESATRFQLKMDNGSVIWVPKVSTSSLRGRRPNA